MSETKQEREMVERALVEVGKFDGTAFDKTNAAIICGRLKNLGFNRRPDE